MAFLQWRRFNFFDREVINDLGTNAPFDLLKEVDIAACSCGRGQMVFGDHSGHLYFLSRHLELTSFKAYDVRVTHLYQLKQHNILVSVGEDEEGVNPLVKVWSLDKMDRAGNPLCSRVLRAIPGTRPSRVSCLTVHENLSLMAVGFDNGSIMLYKGDVTRERHSKQRVLYEGQQKITGLAFKPQQHGKDTNVYVATESEVLCICIMNKDKDRKSVLEFHGCPPLCSVMTDVTLDYQFVIGRQDAVYFYQSDGRGPCLAVEGTKLQVHWFRGYLVVIGKEAKPLPRTTGGTGLAARDMNTVTIYDIHNKFVAYSGVMTEVVDVLCEWGSLYVLTADSKVYHLQEKDTQTKLEILFKKNLYDLAIKLAQTQQYDEDGIVDIFRQYGDHLYNKGDHDNAIEQYIKTIGKLEASYVIRKFLDAQRIHNLTKFLQALHKAQLATEDHTTLLLNCYTKLKDVARLDQFIMTKDREVDFDVETAIRVCRSAGYYQHALRLADKHSQHESYLKVQIEDIHDYNRALDYIGRLPFNEAERQMKKYGKILVNESPQSTTELLKRLCTDYRPSDRPLIDDDTMEGDVLAPPSVLRAQTSEFIHIFVNNAALLTDFLLHMVKVQPSSPSVVYNTLLDLLLQEHVHQEDPSVRSQQERRILDVLYNGEASYDLDHALVLCHMHNFKAGVLFLYKKAKLYQQILQYHMEHNEYTAIIDTCKAFGGSDPQLWVQALSYFARKEENCKQHMAEVLSHIDKCNLLPPLLVVQTLAHNSTATLSVVKDYIVRRLQQENDQISEDERLIKQYQEETAKMKDEIHELKTSARIFQAAKCSVCSHPLELPSVHFLCQHSFHQHCFESYSENDNECPVCLPENRKLVDIVRAQEQSRDLHEQFHQQLERAQDGFSVVADYFGRAVFNKVTVVTDSPVRSPPAVPGNTLPSPHVSRVSESNRSQTLPQVRSLPQLSQDVTPAQNMASRPSGPQARPSQTTGPQMRPSQTTGPQTRPSQSAGPQTRPSQTSGPQTRPSQTSGPQTRPSQSSGPQTRPSQPTGPQTRPSQPTGPPSRPSQSTGPQTGPTQAARPPTSSQPIRAAQTAAVPVERGASVSARSSAVRAPGHSSSVPNTAQRQRPPEHAAPNPFDDDTNPFDNPEPNPFESGDKNPFDEDDNNPFTETTESYNPFDED